jgi:CAAX prenyl protease-like protein
VRTIPFGLWVFLMVMEPWLGETLPEAFDARWLYGIRTGLVLLTLVYFWRHYLELRRPPRASLSDWGLALGLGVVVFVLWIQLDFKPLAFPLGDGFDPRVSGSIDWSLAAVRIGGAALVVPVMEELFWRSFIMRWLQRPGFLAVAPASVGWKAVLISSALFATEHRLWFAGLLAGLAYAWLYKRSENLWIPTVSHAITNALLGAYVLATGMWMYW